MAGAVAAVLRPFLVNVVNSTHTNVLREEYQCDCDVVLYSGVYLIYDYCLSCTVEADLLKVLIGQEIFKFSLYY